VGHHPDAHAHPDGRGQLSGRRDRPPGGCVRLCEQWRQDAQIRRRQSGGIYGILCPVCQRVRCCDPYFGQQQAVVLLPECTAGCRRIRECLRRGQPEHLHRAGLSGSEGSKVGRRRTDGPRHPDEAAEPCQAGGAELRAGPVGLHGEKRPLLRRAGLRGQSAGHQTGPGSNQRRAESGQKIPRKPAHLRGQVHHRPSGRPG